jgi:serine/threonine protein kinase
MKTGEASVLAFPTNDDDDDDNFPNFDKNFEYRGYHKFGRILGRGSFATVIECKRKIDSKFFALKLIKKKAIYKWVSGKSIEKVKNENNTAAKSNQEIPIEVACLLKSSQIEGVIKLNEYWPSLDNIPCDGIKKKEETKTNGDRNQISKTSGDSLIGIILERNINEQCLSSYLNEKKFINENKAKIIMEQLVKINLELLSIGVLHGDLKAENILIERRTKRIKLIDFGSAHLVDLNCSGTKPVKTFRGTNLYKPPEYLVNQMFYPRTSTVWAFGIILYNMVTGDFPFQSENELLEHKNKDIVFSKALDLSNNFKDLIRKCLAFFVADRIIIENVLNHPFMTQK